MRTTVAEPKTSRRKIETWPTSPSLSPAIQDEKEFTRRAGAIYMSAAKDKFPMPTLQLFGTGTIPDDR